jgi:hypothetical protein
MDIAILDQLQRRFGSADFSRYQIVRGQKYDFIRCPFGGGTNQLSFFANPIGATDPVATTSKTLEQTNSVKSASFGQEYFALTQIRTYVGLLPKWRQPAGVGGPITQNSVIYQGYTSLADSTMKKINDLLHRGVLNIKFAQKLYYQIQQPFLTAPAGFGIDISCAGAAKLAAAVVKDNYFIRSDNRGQSVYNVDPIQIIEPEIQVEVTIDFPDGNIPSFSNSAVQDTNAAAQAFTPNIEVGVIFDGYVIRPSQ